MIARPAPHGFLPKVFEKSGVFNWLKLSILSQVGHAVYARQQFAQNVGQRKDVARYLRDCIRRPSRGAI